MTKFQNAQGFLMIELWFAAAFSAAVHPMRSGLQFWNLPIIFFGGFVGLVFGLMLFFLGKAFEKGPSGLTIAGLNSSNVLPSTFLFYFFGPRLGFVYTPLHFLGSALVLIGIFWASLELEEKHRNRFWGVYTFLAMALHVLFFICMEWRAWMIQYPDTITEGRLLPQHLAANPWFTPAMYFVAAFLHTAIFFLKERRIPVVQEYAHGALGGVLNAFYAFFLLWSAERASSVEKAMLFPLFSVATIFFCNLWGEWLYKEKVHWKACQLSFLGILLGTVDWKMLIAHLFF